MKVKRPTYQVLSIAAALKRDWTGYVLQKKLDGRWAEKRVGNSLFIGELMPDKSYIAFDCLVANGCDISGEPLTFRLAQMRALHPSTCPQGSTAEFIEAVLASGSEGVVAKPASSAFGRGWIKVKVCETHDCVVTDICGESIAISENGIDRGRCPVVGGKLVDGWDYLPRVAALRLGDVVEIACHSVHASGKLREPRFVRLRDDKVSA